MLPLFFQSAFAGEEPGSAHLEYSQLYRAALGGSLPLEAETHLGECPECARTRDKFRAEIQRRARENSWQRLPQAARAGFQALGGLAVAGAAVVFWGFFAGGSPAARLAGALREGDTNRIVSLAPEVAGVVPRERSALEPGRPPRGLQDPPREAPRPLRVDFSITPEEVFEPPQVPGFPQRGLTLSLDRPHGAPVSGAWPRIPAPAAGWDPGVITWELSAVHGRSLQGECRVLFPDEVRTLRDLDRRLAGSPMGRARLYGLYGLSARLERALAETPPTDRRQARAAAWTLWPGEPPPR